jgi:hypothetical protein
MNDRSVVLICLAANVAALNTKFQTEGFGPDNFTQRAGDAPEEPNLMGYYAHMLTDETTATQVAGFGVTEEGLTVSVKTGDLMTPEDHLEAMLIGLGWYRWPEEVSE